MRNSKSRETWTQASCVWSLYVRCSPLPDLCLWGNNVLMRGVQRETHRHWDRPVVLESMLCWYLKESEHRKTWGREVMTADSLSRTAGVTLQQSHDRWVVLCTLYKLFKWQLTWGTTQGQRSKITRIWLISLGQLAIRKHFFWATSEMQKIFTKSP